MPKYINIEQLNRPPRYINATELQKVVFDASWCNEVDCQQTLRLIDKAPTEDVVPKSEVEKWYAEYHKVKEDLKQEKMYHKSTDKLADRYLVELKQAKQDIAREIFEDIHKEIELALDSNYKARNNNGYGEFGEYVNGKIHALRGIEDFLAEIEKKYIGE